MNQRIHLLWISLSGERPVEQWSEDASLSLFCLDVERVASMRTVRCNEGRYSPVVPGRKNGRVRLVRRISASHKAGEWFTNPCAPFLLICCPAALSFAVRCDPGSEVENDAYFECEYIHSEREI